MTPLQLRAVLTVAAALLAGLIAAIQMVDPTVPVPTIVAPAAVPTDPMGAPVDVTLTSDPRQSELDAP